MPQIFHPSANTISRASILGLLVLIGLGSYIAWAINRSPYETRQGLRTEQPVPFSHEHHVRGLGIDCRYCHQTVETSAFAGMPPTHTCMSCHSQIWADSPMLEPVRASLRDNTPLLWNRVHDLPDFVYFDHSIHINKGVACIMCHGQVDRMPFVYKEKTLHMEWCLSCHRSPEKFVRPREHVFDMEWKPNEDQVLMGRRLVKEYKIRSLTDCYTCHR